MTAARLDPDDVDHGGDVGYQDVHVPGDGPHDVGDLDPEVTLAAGTVDFGAVRVPVPVRGTVDVEPVEKGRMQAVYVSVPEGRLSVSALAAPKSSRLWPDLVKEIDVSLRDGGARVRSFQGDWGRELHATSGAATSVFVGVDGARWMLYGVATGPTRDADALDEQLRRMLRGTIVVRGRSPYPVRTVLPLEVPEHLAPEHVATVLPADRTPPTTAMPVVGDRTPPTTALPVVPRPAAMPVAVAPPSAPTAGAPLWSDPVHRIADAGGPLPLDAGPDPDDRPTEIRPGRLLPVRDDVPPTGRWAAPRDLVETAPPPPVPSTGGRRRLPDPPAADLGRNTGRRRLPDPPVADPRRGGRRPVDSLASPASGRRHAVDGPMSRVSAPVHDVLRPGRHAVAEPAQNRAAETQPWTAFRPAAETAPWVVTAPDRDPASDTVPLPRIEPAPPVAPDRPTGRHHRPD